MNEWQKYLEKDRYKKTRVTKINNSNGKKTSF